MIVIYWIVVLFVVLFWIVFLKKLICERERIVSLIEFVWVLLELVVVIELINVGKGIGKLIVILDVFVLVVFYCMIILLGSLV